MINPIPKWVWKRYAWLWKKFGNKPFTFEQAQKELKHIVKNVVSVMFNELKTAGWIAVNLNQEDGRKRVYNLLNPISIIQRVKK